MIWILLKAAVHVLGLWCVLILFNFLILLIILLLLLLFLLYSLILHLTHHACKIFWFFLVRNWLMRIHIIHACIVYIWLSSRLEGAGRVHWLGHWWHTCYLLGSWHWHTHKWHHLIGAHHILPCLILWDLIVVLHHLLGGKFLTWCDHSWLRLLGVERQGGATTTASAFWWKGIFFLREFLLLFLSSSLLNLKSVIFFNWDFDFLDRLWCLDYFDGIWNLCLLNLWLNHISLCFFVQPKRVFLLIIRKIIISICKSAKNIHIFLFRFFCLRI